MTLSAVFTINGTQIPGEVAVAYGATVTLALVSTTGVNSVQWSIPGASRTLLTPTIATSGTPAGATATFTMAADDASGRGAAFLVKCLVTDANGTDATAYGIVGVLDDSGVLPFVVGEQLARDAVFGWTTALNARFLSLYNAIPVPAAGDENKLLYVDSSGDIAYTASVLSGGTYLSFGADPSDTGEVRFSPGWSIRSTDTTAGVDRAQLWSDGATLYIGTQTGFDVVHASAGRHQFYAGASNHFEVNTTGVAVQFVPFTISGGTSYLDVSNEIRVRGETWRALDSSTPYVRELEAYETGTTTGNVELDPILVPEGWVLVATCRAFARKTADGSLAYARVQQVVGYHHVGGSFTLTSTPSDTDGLITGVTPPAGVSTTIAVYSSGSDEGIEMVAFGDASTTLQWTLVVTCEFTRLGAT
jgi:hypothetical protein